jgi:hypothetical protein
LRESKSEEEGRKMKENPKILFVIVACLGFFLGNIITDLLDNSIVILPVMIVLIFLMYNLFAFGLIVKMIRYWNLFLEFKEFCSK